MSHDVLPYETPTDFREPFGRAIFGVVVRSIGLIVAVYGFYCLVYACLYAFEAVRGVGPGGYGFAIIGATFLAAGVTLIKGEWLVRFAYDRKLPMPMQHPVVDHE